MPIIHSTSNLSSKSKNLCKNSWAEIPDSCLASTTFAQVAPRSKSAAASKIKVAAIDAS